MEKVIEKELCTGCSACLNICPKNAIVMVEDDDGFMHPVIDNKKCIDCGLCKRTCPVLNTKKNIAINKCYVGYNKDEIIKNNSSSGGVFSLVADWILSNDGIVIGAAFDNNNKLVHIAIETPEELEQLRGSKYLQSELKNIFIEVKKKVENRKVLFVGTPCQIAGLKFFLKKEYANLYCIDLFCHGVPSPKLFTKYIKELENKFNDKLLRYNFRDKMTGWDTYSNTAIFEKNKMSELRFNNNYMKLFLSDIALRESCYKCNFKLGNKYADITLGDFWGIKNYYPELYDNRGVSAIIINTEKGEKLFSNINKKMEYKTCQLEEIIAGNKSLISSSKISKNRCKFFREIDSYKVEELVKKYVKKTTIIKKILRKIKKYIKL